MSASCFLPIEFNREPEQSRALDVHGQWYTKAGRSVIPPLANGAVERPRNPPKILSLVLDDDLEGRVSIVSPGEACSKEKSGVESCGILGKSPAIIGPKNSHASGLGFRESLAEAKHINLHNSAPLGRGKSASKSASPVTHLCYSVKSKGSSMLKRLSFASLGGVIFNNQEQMNHVDPSTLEGLF